MTDFLLILPWGLLGGCVVGFFFVLAKRGTDVRTTAPELVDLRGQLSMLSQTSQQQQQAQLLQHKTNVGLEPHLTFVNAFWRAVRAAVIRSGWS